MSKIKHSQSTHSQARQVFRYMCKHGSINRYEADKEGICHLAARVQNLEEKGFKYSFIDENEVPDFHGILHNGIRRYFIDWRNMTNEARTYFMGWTL